MSMTFQEMCEIFERSGIDMTADVEMRQGIVTKVSLVDQLGVAPGVKRTFECDDPCRVAAIFALKQRMMVIDRARTQVDHLDTWQEFACSKLAELRKAQ